MRLLEYQAKQIFSSYKINVPKSELVTSLDEAFSASERIGFPVAIKAQVYAGGRGKAGGVSIVNSKEELASEFNRIKNMSFSNEKVSMLLIEKAIKHERELYASIFLDRNRRSFVVIASAEGGVDVEQLSEKIIHEIPPEGIDEKTAREISSKLNLGKMAESFSDLLLKLGRIQVEKECELVEVNPIAVLNDELVALDAKMNIDDNALFRHPELAPMIREEEFEKEAQEQGFAFVRLEGDIAVVGNGAGLVLSTLDLVCDEGGNPACFLDLGGGAQRERVEAALRLVNRLENAKKILLNIFGGITRTTDVAQGLLAFMKEGTNKKIYARISGADEEIANSMLRNTGIRLFGNAEDAVRGVVKDDTS